MTHVVAAAADSSRPFGRFALAAALPLIGLLVACKPSIPSGVFSCADGRRCPPGQVCGGDEICRDHDDARGDSGADSSDAAPNAGGDSGADASLEAGPPHDSGVDSGEGGGGSGGKGGTPAAGGGGAGGAGGQGSVQGFHVTTSQPASGGVLDDFGATIKLMFSAQLDPDTVTADSVKLTRDGIAVEGALNATKTEVTFKPDGPWTLAAKYELKLTAAVHDAGDHALEPYTLAFTTRDGKWLREKRVDGTDGVIAAASDGFAALAWAQSGTMYPEMWASQFTPPSTWTAPVQVKDTNVGAFVDQITVNDRHRIAIMWTSISHSISVTPYTTGPSWGPDAYVSQTSYNERMLLNESDELIAVADQPDMSGSNGYGIKGSRYTLGNISPTPIEVGGVGGNNTKPGVALLDGTPRVIWQHATSSASNAPTQIMSGFLNTTTGTSLSADGVVAANAVLAGDPKQTSVIAAWEQPDPTWTNVWAARMVLGANWSVPVRVSDDQSSVSNIQLALDPAGRAVAIWRQAGAVMSSHFSPGTGWAAAEKISAAGAMNIDAPQLVVDAAGNGIAAWTQDGASSALNEVWIARYVRDDGWQAADRVRVSDLEAGTGDTVSLTVDDYGRAFVIWTQANQVWSARFD